MNLDETILSLSPSYFGRRYDSFWVRLIVELANEIRNETDESLDRLVSLLLAYHSGQAIPDESIDQIPHEIVRLRGPGYWRDTSVIGIKFRVLNAIASSRSANESDPDDWLYGILTALQLINLDRNADSQIAARIADGLAAFDSDQTG